MTDVPDTKAGGSAKHAGRDALVTYVVVLAAMFAVSPLGAEIPYLGGISGVVTVLAFLYAPMIVAKHRGEDISAYGFHLKNWRRSLIVAFGSMAVVLPLFIGAHIVFRDIACESPMLVKNIPALNCRADQWDWPNWTKDFAKYDQGIKGFGLVGFVATQLGVVALTEEFFMRGFVLTLLAREWPAKRRFLGAEFGLALAVSAVLFGLIHWPQHGPGHAVATILPGVWFGWAFLATRSILAPVLVHAAANIVQEIFHSGFH